MWETCTSGSVGGPGGKPPGSTRNGYGYGYTVTLVKRGTTPGRKTEQQGPTSLYWQE